MIFEDTLEEEARKIDDGIERPVSFADFNGQAEAKDNLSIYVTAAKKLDKALDHVLFYGPPGMGKTTLSQIIARELDVNIRTLIAPAIKKPSDIISVLAGIERRDVIFIDEIHRLPAEIEEVLYSAMEDYVLNVLVGEGAGARVVSIPIPPFTLIGATTLPGKLTRPMRDRFGISVQLKPYSYDEMMAVITRGANKLGLEMDEGAISEVAKRCRSTPRIGLMQLRRIHDHAVAADRNTVSIQQADDALIRLGVDKDGFNEADRRYIEVLKNRFKGGPVGLNTIATALGDNPDNVEDVIEPYLIQKGVIDRTTRGRVISDPLVKSKHMKRGNQGFLPL